MLYFMNRVFPYTTPPEAKDFQFNSDPNTPAICEEKKRSQMYVKGPGVSLDAYTLVGHTTFFTRSGFDTFRLDINALDDSVTETTLEG
jgi:hypothetical protein